MLAGERLLLAILQKLTFITLHNRRMAHRGDNPGEFQGERLVGTRSRRNGTGRDLEKAAPSRLLHLPKLHAALRHSSPGTEPRLKLWEWESECRHRPSGRRWGDLQRLASERWRPAHAW